MIAIMRAVIRAKSPAPLAPTSRFRTGPVCDDYHGHCPPTATGSLTTSPARRCRHHRITAVTANQLLSSCHQHRHQHHRRRRRHHHHHHYQHGGAHCMHRRTSPGGPSLRRRKFTGNTKQRWAIAGRSDSAAISTDRPGPGLQPTQDHRTRAREREWSQLPGVPRRLTCPALLLVAVGRWARLGAVGRFGVPVGLALLRFAPFLAVDEELVLD